MMMKTKNAPSSGLVILASLAFVAVAFGLAVAGRFGILSENLIDRTMGVLMALVLVVCGNYMPKEVCAPNPNAACDPAKEQSRRRFSGWYFVTIGVLSAICWVVLPLTLAKTATMVLCASAFLVAAWVLWPWIRRQMRSSAT